MDPLSFTVMWHLKVVLCKVWKWSPQQMSKRFVHTHNTKSLLLYALPVNVKPASLNYKLFVWRYYKSNKRPMSLLEFDWCYVFDSFSLRPSSLKIMCSSVSSLLYMQQFYDFMLLSILLFVDILAFFLSLCLFFFAILTSCPSKGSVINK